ncbi:MAG TPA: YtxH domain-containing protein [Terriglobales bacterium]|nr:YtxH domain-containing protein [Terriglobales bacterium]
MRDAGDALEMFAIGAIVGAGLMYLMDPKLGRGRRNYIRDQVTHAVNASCHKTSRFLRDKRNRARGLVAETFHGHRGLQAVPNNPGELREGSAGWP